MHAPLPSRMAVAMSVSAVADVGQAEQVGDRDPEQLPAAQPADDGDGVLALLLPLAAREDLAGVRGRDGVRAWLHPGVEGALVAIAVLVAATVFGLVRRHRDGRLRVQGKAAEGSTPVNDDTGIGGRPEALGGDRLGVDDLGVELGERATLVQFSTAFCAPCRATRRILGEVAGMVDGVAHVEIDAEARLELVRRLNVIRTPTVLVLDGGGRIVRRATGQPRKADVIAALGTLA
ncbi:TlpA family protein disulfide reductase [Actinomadura rugatobispora]|uniref:TlpA family protein disulfide reductase n=1 Tax=Actinomadura rugatobispora TaxID=1994 RepID=A0ABW0ZRW8_9ACTN